MIQRTESQSQLERGLWTYEEVIIHSEEFTAIWVLEDKKEETAWRKEKD